MNWLTTRALPPLFRIERFILPGSLSKMRRLATLAREELRLLVAVPLHRADQNQHAVGDLGDGLAGDVDAGLRDPLDQRPHESIGAW